MVIAAQAVDTRIARLMTWIALILVLATAAAYVALIKGQRDVAPDLPDHSTNESNQVAEAGTAAAALSCQR